MTIQSGEIRTKEFPHSFRGYSPVDVQRFLSEAAARMEELEKGERESARKLVEAQTRLKDYETLENTLRQTLTQAQETTGKAVESARREAQLIIQEAEQKAAQLLEKARMELSGMKEQISILQAKRNSAMARLKMLLNSELDLVKALESDEEFRASENAQNSGLPLPGEPAKPTSEIQNIVKTLDQENAPS